MTSAVLTPAIEGPKPNPAPGQPAQPAQPAVGDARSGDAFAVTSFVLGIASIVSSWTFIAPIIGLILGLIALRRSTTERTLALWGVWMNGALLVLTALIAMGALAVLGIGLIVSLV